MHRLRGQVGDGLLDDWKAIHEDYKDIKASHRRIKSLPSTPHKAAVVVLDRSKTATPTTTKITKTPSKTPSVIMEFPSILTQKNAIGKLVRL